MVAKVPADPHLQATYGNIGNISRGYYITRVEWRIAALLSLLREREDEIDQAFGFAFCRFVRQFLSESP
jgi:hypothetical protein